MKCGKIALSACLAVALACSWGSFGSVGQDMVPASVAAAREAPASSWDEFIGFWEEDLKGEARFTVTPGDGAWYGIEASWPHGANQVEFWTMSAYPAEEHVPALYGLHTLPPDLQRHSSGTGRNTVRKWQRDSDHGRSQETKVV